MATSNNDCPENDDHQRDERSSHSGLEREVGPTRTQGSNVNHINAINGQAVQHRSHRSNSVMPNNGLSGQEQLRRTIPYVSPLARQSRNGQDGPSFMIQGRARASVSSLYPDIEYSTASDELDTPPPGSYPLTNEDGPIQRIYTAQELEDYIGVEALTWLVRALMHRPGAIAAAMQPNGRVRAAILRLAVEGLRGLDNAIDVLRTEMAPPDVSPAFR
nr:hypothetical protein CFP56_03658 [Quercus suber]